MFDNLTKLMQILTRENSMQRVLFYFSTNTGNIKNFSIKNLEQYKKMSRGKFVKKKRRFCKTFCCKEIFFIIALNVAVNILFNEVRREL